MADATVALEASNLFGLHTNFQTQSSTTSATTTEVNTLDEFGNVECEQQIGGITEYTQSATYCGSDFVSDFGTFLTTFGDVQNSKLVSGITLNMNAGEYATIEITGHNHDSNAHSSGASVGRSDVSDFLPHEATEAFNGWDGFGVPDFGITVGSNSSPSSATVTFSLNHVEADDEAGDHLVGKSITHRCELAMSFEGTPTSSTAAALETDFGANTNDMLSPTVDNIDTADSNSAFDTFGFSAHAYVDIA